MNRLCYISRNYRSSGNKAKIDIEDLLQDMGATNLGLKRSHYNSKVITFLLDLAGVVRCCLQLKKGDVLFLQYPVKKYFSFLCRAAHLHQAKAVALIHDLGSFRRKKLTVQGEIERLSHANYVIASNQVMQQWLIEQGLQRPTGALELFDYLTPTIHGTHTPYRQGHARVVYAGALAKRKNSFILQLMSTDMNYELHIYGKKEGLPGLHETDSIKLRGFAPAEEFVAKVDADFGLVWDGDSVDSCTGNFGEYLRYNSPHKASFYLRAGLPVIVWSQSALATVVDREGIGFSISSMHELNAKLSSLSPSLYENMVHHVERIQARLRDGSFLRQSILAMQQSLDVRF